MLTITTGWIDGIIAIAVEMFEDVGLLIILAIALPLGFYLARKVIALVRVG